MGLRDVRGLRVPINHPPAPLEVPQRPLRSDTNTSSPSDSPQTPQSPRVHLILETSQSPSMPRKPLEGPQRAPQTPPITPQRPPPAPIAPQSPRGNQEPLGDPPSPTSPSNLHVDKARGHARLAQQEVGQGEVASPHGQVQRCQAAFGVLGERHGSGGAPQEVPPPYNLLNFPKGATRDPGAWQRRSVQPMGTLKGDTGLSGGHRGVVGVSHPSPILPRCPSGPQWPGAQVCPAHRDFGVGL